MSNLPRDPWQAVTTFNGLKADHVISALQKEIRRGNSENAALLAYEMVITSPALEDFLWQRLMVISVEDVGFGEPSAPILINSMHQMLGTFDRSVGERRLFAVHAVRYLCNCAKDRSSDEMINWMIHGVDKGTLRPTIPDYALDMHTKDGQAMGRGKQHFWEEGAKIRPELPDRDKGYLAKIQELLEAGDIG
ncbi:MAG: replication-associated recombination protein RarA [Candidatus Promineifilaceae bacterium]|jgi:replication-associated recombination protein RarA